MAGDRQLVREAVAAYFGGTRNTTDAGIYYTGGSLAASGLGSAWPYAPKGIPDQLYTVGVPAGTQWGAVLRVELPDAAIRREAVAGATSGWRGRRYTVACDLWAISYEPHLETAEAAFDDLIDSLIGLIYADRTLGTTSATYPTGRLITQAGEGPFGLRVRAQPFEITDEQRGRGAGYAQVTFEALTMVQA